MGSRFPLRFILPATAALAALCAPGCKQEEEGYPALIVVQVDSPEAAGLWPMLSHVDIVIDPALPWATEDGSSYDPVFFEGTHVRMEDRDYYDPTDAFFLPAVDSQGELIFAIDLTDWARFDEDGEPNSLPSVAVAPGANYRRPYRIWADAFSVIDGEQRLVARSALFQDSTPAEGELKEMFITGLVFIPCFNQRDEDGDGWTDAADPDCTPGTVSLNGSDALFEWGWNGDAEPCEDPAVPRPLLCNNGCDDDGDGWVDGEDPDCSAAEDDEDLPFGGFSECNDGVDNDRDGTADRGVDLDGDGFFGGDGEYGPDSDCVDPWASESTETCANGHDDDGDGWIDADDPDCDPAGPAAEVDYRPDWPSCIYDLGAPLRPATPPAGWPSDWLWDPLDSNGDGLAFPTECSDGCDNDGDLRFDGLDSACVSAFDNNEASTMPACGDGLDNDGDGRADGADSDCISGNDPSEASACSDGFDNDGDGLVDDDDPGCTDRTDRAE